MSLEQRALGSILELPRLFSGFRFSLEAMWAQVSSLNLLEPVPVASRPTRARLRR